MVDILLAVYNGEKYIRPQIESILAQSYTDWRLLIRDDCSNDSTLEIINSYAKRYAEKIKIFKGETNSGSAASNFFWLCKKSSADYIMMCDQDDFWLSNKIELTLKKIQVIERKSERKCPILVHTDLKPVDANLNELAESMFRRQNLNASRDKLNYLLAQNIITGCTVMVNRELLKYCKTIPQQVIMHDWWFGLIASAFGKIGFVDKTTMLYRQHEANQVGAKDAKSAAYIAKRAAGGNSNKKVVQDTYLQAKAFAKLHQDKLDETKLKIVQNYASMPEKSKAKRITTLFKYRLWKYGLVRKIGQILYC